MCWLGEGGGRPLPIHICTEENEVDEKKVGEGVLQKCFGFHFAHIFVQCAQNPSPNSATAACTRLVIAFLIKIWRA